MKTIVASHNPDLARDFDRDLLRRRDLRLVTARTTDELLDRLREGADLCFLDHVLPDGGGDVALAAIRADKKLGTLPVVLVVASGSPASYRTHARSAGFTDVVELPAAPGALSLIVGRLLGVPLRDNDRFAVRVHVFGQDGGDDYLGTSADLSENGMLLKARREVPVGTTLELRFALPGRAGELKVSSRVVRVDVAAFQPARGLALAFEDLQPFERHALHDYLRVLLKGRPFQWQVGYETGKQVVSLSGVLDAHADLDALRALEGEVQFRLREFRRIGSDSVQRWIDFVRSLEKAQRIQLIECPISFIHQANLITNLLERQEVVSFFAPYACDACGLEDERLIDVLTDLEGGKRRTPPAFNCTACRAPLAFDDLVEQYFSFLDR